MEQDFRMWEFIRVWPAVSEEVKLRHARRNQCTLLIWTFNKNDTISKSGMSNQDNRPGQHWRNEISAGSRTLKFSSHNQTSWQENCPLFSSFFKVCFFWAVPLPHTFLFYWWFSSRPQSKPSSTNHSWHQTIMCGYLIGALPDCVDELLDDQVDAFQTGLFQLNDLLFHYGFKRHVGGEQACPEGHMDKTDTDAWRPMEKLWHKRTHTHWGWGGHSRSHTWWWDSQPLKPTAGRAENSGSTCLTPWMFLIA